MGPCIMRTFICQYVSQHCLGKTAPFLPPSLHLSLTPYLPPSLVLSFRMVCKLKNGCPIETFASTLIHCL